MNTQELQPFPIDSLPARIRPLVEAAAHDNQVEVQLPASLALAAISALMGRATEIDAKRRRKTPPNLYFLTGAEPGTGKTVMSNLLMRPATRLLRREATRMNREEEKAPPPLLYASDATDAALRKCCAGSPHGTFALITSDGRDIIDNIVGKHSHGRFAGNALIDGFSGDQNVTARITRDDTYCENPCIVVSALPQPEKLSELFEHPDIMKSGLGIRILACIAEKTPMPPAAEQVTDSMVADWEKLLESVASLYAYSGDPALLKLGGAAMRERDSFEAETSALEAAEPNSDLQNLIRRQDEMAHRLCNLFHVIRWCAEAREKTVVATEDWVGAARIVRWYLSQILALTGVVADNDDAKRKARVLKLYSVIQSKKPPGTPITANDLRLSGGILRTQLEALVAAYPNEFALVEHRTGRAGRVPVFFEVKSKAS
jgi:hypothetical protein